MTSDPLDYHEVCLWALGKDIHGTEWWSKMVLGPQLASLPPDAFFNIIGLHAQVLMEDMTERDVLIENIRWHVTVDLMTVRDKLEYRDS